MLLADWTLGGMTSQLKDLPASPSIFIIMDVVACRATALT